MQLAAVLAGGSGTDAPPSGKMDFSDTENSGLLALLEDI